ncbi:MAG TPA: rhodanese-like domain-containing protein [Candidatus Acidoferrum sp.]|nr:rhodanese-like domain-containing protein [Candidatus Acidoferrum sp.]
MLTWMVIAGVVAAFLLLKYLGQVSRADARAWLAKGALVIDVRSEAEFQERHLPGAINIPLNRLSAEVSRYATNKDQPLLLHCLSGARSGMGARTLRRLGYPHAFNLGSYGRAEKIVRGQ